jgi:hypothetical protein
MKNLRLPKTGSRKGKLNHKNLIFCKTKICKTINIAIRERLNLKLQKQAHAQTILEIFAREEDLEQAIQLPGLNMLDSPF